MSEDNEKPSTSRRSFLRTALAATGITAGVAYLGWNNRQLSPSEQRSRDTKDATGEQMRATAITDLSVTATARQEDRTSGKEPHLFTPEYGFTEEDFKKAQGSTVRVIAHGRKDNMISHPDANGVVTEVKDGEVSLLVSQHLFDKVENQQWKSSFGEYEFSIVRPDKSGRIIKGHIVDKTQMKGRDEVLVHFKSDNSEEINDIELVPIVSDVTLSQGEPLMTVGYPSILTNTETYQRKVEDMQFSSDEILVEYVKVGIPEGHRIIEESNLEVGLFHFYPWKNSEGGSGSGMYRKRDEQIELVALYAGSNTTEYTDVSGNPQRDVVGKAYLVEDLK